MTRRLKRAKLSAPGIDETWVTIKKATKNQDAALMARFPFSRSKIAHNKPSVFSQESDSIRYMAILRSLGIEYECKQRCADCGQVHSHTWNEQCGLTPHT